MVVLDHRDMELARQAEEGHARQAAWSTTQVSGEPSREHAVGDGRHALDLGQQVAGTVEQHEQHERPDGQQRQRA